MARLSLLLLVACAAASASLQATPAQADFTAEDLQNAATLLSNLPAAFKVFKEKFQKSYPGSEDQQRYLTFASNVINAAGALSAQNPDATFGVTPYSDLTDEEFSQKYLSNVPTFTQSDAETLCNSSDPATCGMTIDSSRRSFWAKNLETDAHRLAFEDLPEKYRRRRAYRDFGATPEQEDSNAPPQNKAFAPADDTIPQKVDWRTKGVVGSIKYQGACGACWAFVVTGVVESLWGIAGHQVPDLSEQQLLSCVSTNQACDGGIMQNAWSWVVKSNDGYLASEEYYPYVSADDVVPACSNTGAGAAAKINSYVSIARNEVEMQKYVANNGPISIAIEAKGWQSYTGGVLSTCNQLMTTHAVVVVGYDTQASPPYWICKNSWSTDWGEGGYIRIEMWKNVCLIADNPSTGLITSELTEALPTGDPDRRVKNAASGMLTFAAASISAAAALIALMM